jgi:hypothetical protein
VRLGEHAQKGQKGQSKRGRISENKEQFKSGNPSAVCHGLGENDWVYWIKQFFYYTGGKSWLHFIVNDQVH